MYSKDSQSERNNQSDDATRISPERGIWKSPIKEVMSVLSAVITHLSQSIGLSSEEEIAYLHSKEAFLG